MKTIQNRQKVKMRIAVIGQAAYHPVMIDPTNRTKAQWMADLAESEAEADAGMTVPLAPALERARAAVRRLEAKARHKPHEAARHN